MRIKSATVDSLCISVYVTLIKKKLFSIIFWGSHNKKGNVNRKLWWVSWSVIASYSRNIGQAHISVFRRSAAIVTATKKSACWSAVSKRLIFSRFLLPRRSLFLLTRCDHSVKAAITSRAPDKRDCPCKLGCEIKIKKDKKERKKIKGRYDIIHPTRARTPVTREKKEAYLLSNPAYTLAAAAFAIVPRKRTISSGSR